MLGAYSWVYSQGVTPGGSSEDLIWFWELNQLCARPSSICTISLALRSYFVWVPPVSAQYLLWTLYLRITFSEIRGNHWVQESLQVYCVQKMHSTYCTIWPPSELLFLKTSRI